MPAAQFSSLVLALAIAAIQAVPVSAQSAGARSRFVADAAPFLKSYCLRCHSTDNPTKSRRTNFAPGWAIFSMIWPVSVPVTRAV